MRLVLGAAPEVRVPFLYEIWNWVGDKSILPTKWYELLKKYDNQTRSSTFSGISKEVLINRFVKDDKFDPNGFFFLTTRSEVVAGALVWPVSTEICEIIALAALPAHRDRETAETIIALALNYAASKGFKEIIYTENE